MSAFDDFLGPACLILILFAIGVAAPIFLISLMLRLVREVGDIANLLRTRFDSLSSELRNQQRLLERLLKSGGQVAGEQATGEQAPPAPGLAPAGPPLHAAPPTVEAAESEAITELEVVPEGPAPESEPAPEHRQGPAPKPAALGPLAPRPPRAPSRRPQKKASPGDRRTPRPIELAMRKALSEISNWIVVGEEHRAKGVSMEFAIASTWLLRLGLVILVLSAVFFLKYSIEQDLIGPLGRVGIAFAGGTLMIAAGVRLIGRQVHVFGEGLIGGGIAVLYFAAYAAYNFYGLIDAAPAFALMALVTVCAAGLAVRLNSLLTAVAGLLGGYGTPLMLSTGEVRFVELFSYMLLLGGGVLTVSYWKNWRLLHYLSLACNYAVFVLVMADYQTAQFWQAMPFLSAFFVLFSTMLFLYHVVRESKATVLETIGLIVNAGIFFGFSYTMIDDAFERRWVSVVTLSVAAFYVAHTWLCLARRELQRELLFTFMGLAAFFLAVTVPLLLSREWITASWAIQALTMLWIAGKLDSRFLRHVAYLLYAIVVGRFCLLDLPRQYAPQGVAGVAPPAGEYVRLLLERLAAFGVPIATLAGAFRLLKAPQAPGGLAVDREHDMPDVAPEKTAMLAFVCGAAGLAFLYLHLEIDRTALYAFAPFRWPALTLLWVAACAWLLAMYLANRVGPWLNLLAAFVVLMVCKLVIFDMPSWHVSARMRYDGRYSPLEAGMRLIDFGAMIALLAAAFFLLAGERSALAVRKLAGFAALALLFVFLSLEANTARWS